MEMVVAPAVDAVVVEEAVVVEAAGVVEVVFVTADVVAAVVMAPPAVAVVGGRDRYSSGEVTVGVEVVLLLSVK